MAKAESLTVEFNPEFAQADDVLQLPNGGKIAFTPPVGDDYWLARVVLHKNQAIVCFPKFFTVGCGFAKENDWNTNLPLSCDAEQIFGHIKHNKKYKAIKDDDCIAAIRLLQQTVLPIVWKREGRNA